MSTYAENAAARERSGRKVAQDNFLRGQTQLFDGQAAEGTDKRGNWKGMKYERPSFTVVTASDKFRTGYDQITWGENELAKDLDLEPSDKSGSVG